MKSKKIIISLGAIGAIAFPASTILSCSYNEERNMLTYLTSDDIKGQLDLLGTSYGQESLLYKKQNVWDAIDKFFTEERTPGATPTATLAFNNNAANNHQYDKFIGIYIKLTYDDKQIDDKDLHNSSFVIIILSISTAHYKFNNQQDLLKEIPKAHDNLFNTIKLSGFDDPNAKPNPKVIAT